MTFLLILLCALDGFRIFYSLAIFQDFGFLSIQQTIYSYAL